jgi:polysaccharide biosynthesis protein PslH
MRIFFLSPRTCWPPVTGARLREYHLLRALAARAEVTYACFRDTKDPPLDAELSFCRRIVCVNPPPMYTMSKILLGLVGRWPLPVVNYTSSAMASAIENISRNGPFDVLHLDSIHMAAYVAQLPPGIASARVVYDWHNIESESMRRYSESLNPLTGLHRKAYARWTASRLAALERSVLGAAAGHIVCSSRERDQLLINSPGARIEVIENGVDNRLYAENALPGNIHRRNRLVFVGSMNYHANIDAVTKFVRYIWPSLRQRFPEWRLTLVGSDPTSAVLALGDQPGVEVTGRVPDVRPYYQEAIAAVVPLRMGGGTRLKILEAMAAGVPVVSTTIGTEGLAVTPGINILLADTDEDWLVKLSSLVTNPSQRTSLAAAAQRLTRTSYDWDIIGQKLYNTYLSWLE